MVSGDVFRSPKSAVLLCVQLGTGVQIILSAFATLFFAALGAQWCQGPSNACPAVSLLPLVRHSLPRWVRQQHTAGPCCACAESMHELWAAVGMPAGH